MTRWTIRPSPAATEATIPFPAAAAGWLAAFAVGGLLLAGALSAAVEATTGAEIPALLVGLLGMWGAFVVALVVLSRTSGTGDFRRDYAVDIRPVDLAMVPLGIGLQFSIGLVYWPLRQLWPATFSDDALSETARDLIERANGINLVLIAFAVVVGAPIIEELVYRGLLQRSLSGAWRPVAAWVAASAWFGVIHFRPVELLGLFLAGLLFGAGYLFTGRIGPAMLAHVAFNATGLAMAYRSVPGTG